MNGRRFVQALTAAMVLLLLTSTVAAQSKFHSSQEEGGAPGRYRVELELRPGDDLAAISGQMAATYGARIEPYAEEGFTGFAIIATSARARLMSADPRVVAIVDLNEVLKTGPPQSTEPSGLIDVVQKKAPAPATEQIRRDLTTDAVPGFGNYTYDGSGNITSIDSHVFRYDAFGRLQSAVLGGFGSKGYTYDRYGNILKIVTDGDDVHAARMSVDPDTNQMDLPFSGSNPANMIATYDAVGNVVVHQGSYIYDALNMMKEMTDTARRLHVYSASGERVVVVQVDSGVETTSEWTIRDGANRVLRRFTKDTGGIWHWKEDYIYGGARLLAAEVPGAERVRHFHLDHLGTPRLITGNGGVRIAEKTYDPFGRKLTPATDDFEQLEFTGHERDVPSLDYMHARYYQADLGRFFSVDPVLQLKRALHRPQLWNRYTYVLNNPMVYTDPTGQTVYLVTYTTGNTDGDDEFRRAAETRAAEIQARDDFDSKKDTVLVRGVATKNEFAQAVRDANALAPKFGKVGEVSLFSHAGKRDGPIFQYGQKAQHQLNANDLRMTINWEWWGSGRFYGCNTGINFTRNFANAQNVAAWGYEGSASFSSTPYLWSYPASTGPLYLIHTTGFANGGPFGFVSKWTGLNNLTTPMDPDEPGQ
jgi:RHS repeat-associated protein